MAYHRLSFGLKDDSQEGSSNTMPDISLGSLEESFKSPSASLTRHPAPLSLLGSTMTTSSSSLTHVNNGDKGRPSTPKGLKRRGTEEEVRTPKPSDKSGMFDDLDDEDEGIRKWESDNPVGRLARSKSGVGAGAGAGKGGVNMTLREQEKVIDSLKKENFSLKLKVHFLEERLAQLAPDHIEAALKQNINLKIEVQSRGVELKKYKKLLLQMEQELARSKAGDSREKQLERENDELRAELRELRRRGGSKGGRDDLALVEARGRNEELERELQKTEEELEQAKALIEDNLDEIDRLKDARANGSVDSHGGESRRAKLEEALKELDEENALLKDKLGQVVEELDIREEEKEELADKVEALSLHIEELERRRADEAMERSQSRAHEVDGAEERERLEDMVNSLRDKLAATNIELQTKEDEIQAKAQEIEEIIAEHESIVRDLENNWRGEVDDARNQVEDLRDLVTEKESELEGLREQIGRLTENTEELKAKFEVALGHLEEVAAAKEEEILDANEKIQELGDKMWRLEEVIETEREEVRIRLDEAEVEREQKEMVLNALKEKLAIAKEQQAEATELYETCHAQILQHRQREEELAAHAEELSSALQNERDAREDLEAEREDIAVQFNELDAKFDDARREWEDSARRERRQLEDVEAQLGTAKRELEMANRLLEQRESDIKEIQGVLEKRDFESRRLGESERSDRFSLNLELERLRRDVTRAEDDVQRLKRDLDERDAKVRDREGALDKLHVENRELAGQLATQTQARLNLSEKLDSVQASLKTAEAEVANLRAKVNDLEGRLSKDQRNLLSVEHQYRDQLTERNTLLLTVYQYLDKILGVEKTAKSETKPFTNFAVFHDNLISRLKAVTNIQSDFDKRCKETEAKFLEKMAEVKKQLDFRWKQLDRFETSVKGLVEVKHSWRRKYNAKEVELETAKATASELQTQLSSVRRAPTSDNSELRALTARATNAERRLTIAQNQLAAAEEKFTTLNERTASADTKWEARVREYETRLKGAEERVKRERQGAKERIKELEEGIAKLQRQLEGARRRDSMLGEVLEMQRPLGEPASSTPR